MSTQDAVNPRKRKNPPTFQHLPVQRAKKLKQAWVEKTKIKSKWKHEKRKMQGEGTGAKLPWEIAKEYDEGQKIDEDQESKEQKDVEEEWDGAGPHSDSEEVDRDDNAIQDNGPPLPDGDTISPKSQSARKEPEARQNSRSNRTHHERPNNRSRLPTKDEEDEDEPEQPSLRDLKREAYSRATLHHYKSDPLHKRPSRGRGGHAERGGRGGFSNRGGRGGFSDRGSRGPRGRGGPPPRGRGQPDMKLRMNVMLEKIKRDLQ
ncbi:hypothetical protein BKA70DRAFT_1248731 [Coprinopsis sp. MPI-PUGE-AT-0042]|nr:hypothetical protein BKA70DRAFT_1248731 [Coprinopsis sp. MPI-PUGE-AT-0042]